MFSKVIAAILLIAMGVWIVSSIVSIVKSVKKKLRKRSEAAADAQNKNSVKECDQSDASDEQK